MLILNTGGTFNKKYNLKNGLLEIPYNNNSIEIILNSYSCDYNLAGVVYKDSLDITSDDRVMIANIISESNEEIFIIIHGTDTINKTAEFLDEIFDSKLIILLGSMKPFEIDKIEPSLNLGIAIGYSKASNKKGVFISMSGHIEKWDKLVKNKNEGKFELV